MLEYSANLLAPAPGRLLSYHSGTGQTILDGLNGPSSLALDADNGKLYIASRTDGTILQLDIGK